MELYFIRDFVYKKTIFKYLLTPQAIYLTVIYYSCLFMCMQ